MNEQGTERYDFSASGRLGLWNTFSSGAESFLDRLAALLRRHAGACLEAEGGPLQPAEETGVAALAAVLDTLVSRGHPTLIDLDFEHYLLANGPPLTTDAPDTATNGRPLERRLVAPSVTAEDLLQAAEDLLARPFTAGHARHAVRHTAGAISREEDVFYQAFGRRYGVALHSCLQRRPLVRALIGEDHPELIDRRVDFALECGPCRWVFNVDGRQHDGPGLAGDDQTLNGVLNAHDWRVWRVPAETVRSNVDAWFREAWEPSLPRRDRERMASFGPAEDVFPEAAYRLAMHAVVWPHVVHRCLRGLVQMIRLSVLPVGTTGRQLRVLVVEEDIPAVAEAFRQLLTMWRRLRVLSARTPEPPRVVLYVIGNAVAPIGRLDGLEVVHVPEPEPVYDLILSHSYTFTAGRWGLTFDALPPGLQGRRVWIRSTRSHYDDSRLSGQDDASPEPLATVDPGALSLRYLAACARIRNNAEEATSMHEECVSFFRQAACMAPDERRDALIVRVLDEVEQHRPEEAAGLTMQALRMAGSSALVRAYLQQRNRWPDAPEARRAMLTLLTADALARTTRLRFYDGLIPDRPAPTPPHAPDVNTTTLNGTHHDR